MSCCSEYDSGDSPSVWRGKESHVPLEELQRVVSLLDKNDSVNEDAQQVRSQGIYIIVRIF